MTPEQEKAYKDRIIAALRAADASAAKSWAGEGNYVSSIPDNIESLSLPDLMRLAGSVGALGVDAASGWDNRGGLYTLDENDPGSAEFRAKFGPQSGFSNVELQNRQLGSNLRFSYEKPTWFDEGAQDKTRIMQLPDGRWVWEENNLRGDYVKNEQAKDADSGFFHGDAMDIVKVAAFFAGASGLEGLLSGAAGAGEGALGLDALESYTATNPGWQEAITSALEPALPMPEVDIPELMDPLNPTEIPDIQTPTLDGPPNGTVSTDGNWQLPDADTLPAGQDNFDTWLENYLGDTGTGTVSTDGNWQLPGSDTLPVGMDNLAETPWYESLWNTVSGPASSLVGKLPALANALKYAIPQGGGAGGSRASGLGGLGGGGGGLGGGGGGRAGIASDPFEAEKLKKVLALSEYLGSLK